MDRVQRAADLALLEQSEQFDGLGTLRRLLVPASLDRRLQ